MYDSDLNWIYEDFPHTFLYVGEKKLHDGKMYYKWLPLKTAKMRNG